MLVSQSEKWDKLAYIHDRERETACRAYLDLIAGRRTENVEAALRMKLGSAMLVEVPYILELVGDVQGKRVLDAGCGGGFYSLWMAEKGANVTGIDGSKEMIRIATKKASKRKLDVVFLVGDVSDMRIEDDTFDVILSTLVLMDIKNLDKAADELVRVTKCDGDLVISVSHPILTAGHWVRESGLKLYRELDDYFVEITLTHRWETENKERISLDYYHRPLQAYVKPFLERECVLTNLVEPYPYKAYQTLNPTEYEDTKRIPHFIIFKFRKAAMTVTQVRPE